MTEKRIVIKINQKKMQDTVSSIEPEMITEWNIPRLIMFFLGLILIIGMVFFWVTDQSEEEANDRLEQNPQSDNEVRNNRAETNNVMTSAVVKKKIDSIPVKTEETVAVEETDIHIKKDTANVIKKYKFPVKVNIADKRVSRAVIAYSLKQKEPEEIVTGWVKADKAKAVGVYFFTEINQMKGEVLFHKWYLNNKIVFSRRLNILGNHWRASTSKLITYSQKGEWRVTLVNRNQQVLAEIRFYVI